jgi:lactoylglutathione lyase
MIRVKDAEVSLKFYQDIMGMKLLRKSESQAGGFTLFFLGYGPSAPEATANGVNPVADREGLLELTWNHGTEKDANFKYHDGNTEPQGFGHICVSVDDLDAACARLEEKGVNWKKRLTDGGTKDLAFALGTSFSNAQCTVLIILKIPMATGSRLCRTKSSRHVQAGEFTRTARIALPTVGDSHLQSELATHSFSQSYSADCYTNVHVTDILWPVINACNTILHEHKPSTPHCVHGGPACNPSLPGSSLAFSCKSSKTVFSPGMDLGWTRPYCRLHLSEYFDWPKA